MAEGKQTVLVVDRDRITGLVSKMLMGRFQPDVAPDGLMAVRKLREAMPAVIVVDVDIPGGGIKLAELIGMSPKYQGVQVILTAGNPSPDTILRARAAGASSFLAKPYGPAELLRRVDSALRASAQPPAPVSGNGGSPQEGEGAGEGAEAEGDGNESESIRTRVRNIEGLPTFPATHAQIMELANSDESSSDDIAEQIQLDPSMLATVFKLVNSSYYGFSKKVDSISLAVTLLGLEEIANLVMAAQVFEKLGGYEDGAGLDLQAFWRHSVGTGFAARAIAKKLQTEPESAFLAGMLHDLGKIVLDRYFSDYYADVFKAIHEGGVVIVDVERDLLGVTHAEIGGVLAEEWRFSQAFTNAIMHHHCVSEGHRYQRLVCLVHLADMICRRLEFGSSGDSEKPDFEEAALDRFSLGEKGIELLTEATEEELDDADSFLSALSS